MLEDQGNKLLYLALPAHTGKKNTWSAFFHTNRYCINVQGALRHQELLGKGDSFRRHIIDIADQFRYFFMTAALMAKKGPDTVGPFKILGSHAIAGFLQRHHRHIAKTGGKILQQSRSRRGA
ncbi:hypothetical protein SDC9_175494 [bioreactor metagenome]|uniref:Uncharacterized protein n=1 Tax=bioreactor metagenome TaxID=1076179 RepID=A0A645GMU4_9ZZZZ